MSSTALKATAVVLVLLTLALAVLGFLVSRNFANRTVVAEAEAAKAAEAQAQASKALAVVALKPLAAYKSISRDDISLVPVAVVPTGYFANVDEVAGRTPLTDIDAGSPVTRRYFKEASSLARLIPPGHQALALEVNEVVAAGGFLRPGDLVDVLVYLRNGPGVAQPQARSLLENVRVLAYEDRLIDRPQSAASTGAAADDTNNTRRRQRTAVLAIPQAETTRVLLGASLGELRLSLRAEAAEKARSSDAVEVGARLEGRSGNLITAEELARGGKLASEPAPVGGAAPAPTAAEPPKPKPAPRPTVEILRGSSAEQVPQ